MILRNERQLLQGNLVFQEEVAEDDLFPSRFSVQRFVEIVETGEVWSVLKRGEVLHRTVNTVENLN